MKKNNWITAAIMLVPTTALLWWVCMHNNENTGGQSNSLPMISPRFTHDTNPPSFKSSASSNFVAELEKYRYQISTNLAALPLDKRLFVTNNFIPTANQFLRQFPTQHHPFEAKDIKAVSVNYGVNGYVGVAAKIESDDGAFQILTQTVGGTNNLQCFQDLTDFNISVPGTVSELRNMPVGMKPSAISSAAEAKAFAHELLQKYNFDFQNYLNPPIAVPYTALPNYGLWQVHYISKRADSGQSYVDFVIDGTGSSGPFFRWAYQVPYTWSLPSTPQN